MKRILRRIIYSLIIISLFLISGCWDSKEVESLAITTLITWDLVNENGIDRWQVGTRILRVPGKKDGGKSEAEETLVKGTGITIQEAFQDLAKRLPSNIFYQHTQALIVGERVAQEELDHLITQIIRYPGNRLRNHILISRGEAFQAIKAQPELLSLLSREVRLLSENSAEYTGTSERITFKDFTMRILKEDQDSLLPEIKIYKAQEDEEISSPSVVIEGFGVFRKSKLVGWLNPNESLGYLLLTKNNKQCEIPITVNYQENIIFSYYLISHSSQITSELIDGVPKFTIKVNTKGMIHETTGPILKPEELEKLELAAAKRIEEIVWETVNKSFDYQSDFLRLNENLHRWHLSDWREIEDDWRERFQDAEIEIRVEANVQNFGVVTESIELH